MPRRVILLLLLMVLAGLAATVAPWTLTGGGLADSVAEQLRDGYGVSLTVRGRSTIALLPVPRMKFEDVSLASPSGAMQAEGGTLRGELRVASLLRGRVELSEVSLADSRITLSDKVIRSFDLPRAVALFGEQDDVARLRRVTLSGTSVRWSSGASGSLDRVTGIVSWRDPKGGLELTGWGIWRGERVEITHATIDPALAASGRPSPFKLAMTGAGGHLLASGEAQLGPDPRITGQGSLAFRSVRDFARWSGLELPLGSLVQSVGIDGDFTVDRRRIGWPSVTLKLGSDRLEGALGIRIDGPRPVVTGTLAAEKLNLSDFFAGFAQARTAAGLWSTDDITLQGSTGGDLDLRLSATESRLGRLRVSDMAASVLVRPGRIEASLGRASVRNGSLKGRLTLANTANGTELKTQGTFDQVDVGAVLNDFGQRRWITGHANGHFTLEGSGRTVLDLVRQTQGKTGIVVKQGELVGIGLNDVLSRAEKQPLSAFLDWRGGRTAFDQAAVNLSVGAGVGEIVDGAMLAPAMHTALEGRVSLTDRSLAVRAHVNSLPSGAASSATPIDFNVSGSWDDVDVIPDAKALIERSGAAKRLLGMDRLPAGSQDASAVPATDAQ